MCIIRERIWLETVIGKKLILFREKHAAQSECGPSQKASVQQSWDVAWLVFTGCIISYADE